ncbi:MAG: PrsW family glutamic-type intramembrane protease [Oscillospiraceae bacterium]|nr:PrsW family glutamic-type intramembrane protease [Oscillospiraceae bacterium]
MNYLMTLALLPVILLIIFVRKLDRIEPEPKPLLIKLLAFSALSIIPVAVLENLGDTWLTYLQETTNLPKIVFSLLEYFVVVAGLEEFAKWFVMKKVTWNHPAFDYTFDGIVYAVTASMGFAAVENILYALGGGFSVALMRAVTAIPGHAIFGLFMGINYGIAKKHRQHMEDGKKRLYLFLSLFCPMLIHGCYDFILSLDKWYFTALFIFGFILLTFYSYRLINRKSMEDTPVSPRFSSFEPDFDSFQMQGTPPTYTDHDTHGFL